MRAASFQYDCGPLDLARHRLNTAARWDGFPRLWFRFVLSTSFCLETSLGYRRLFFLVLRRGPEVRNASPSEYSYWLDSNGFTVSSTLNPLPVTNAPHDY